MKNDQNDDDLPSNINDWISKITFIKKMTAEERENFSKRNFEFVQLHYSNEALDKVWQEIFSHVIAS